ISSQEKEQAMADAIQPLTDEASSERTESKTEEAPSPSRPDISSSSIVAEPPPESGTKGMLREAIQKVMKEIEFHEEEAKRHLQQAEFLRKELRDSFSFLQDQKGKGRPTAALPTSNSDSASEPEATAKTAHVAATPRRQPAKSKKQHAGKAK